MDKQKNGLGIKNKQKKIVEKFLFVVGIVEKQEIFGEKWGSKKKKRLFFVVGIIGKQTMIKFSFFF